MAEPKAFGRYLLLDRVAYGGMAEIYTAKSFGADGFDRLLAIKRVLPSVADDDQFVQMFRDEAKITQALSHANIVQVTDFGNIDNSYYLAMEYISGKDLKHLWSLAAKSGEYLDFILVAYIIAAMAEGLSYAHNATDATGRPLGVIHRDVTPQNVLVSWDGEVKLVDFGIAKARAKSLKTEVGVLKGKFAYMSPEQVRGLPLTKRTDIFSLGIVLYELLTGERAFDQETDYAIMEAVRRVDVVPPPVRNPSVPDELVRICGKAMAAGEEERYDDGEQMARELRAWIASTGRSFGRLELAAFLKRSFPDDFREERERLTRYAQVKPDALDKASEDAPIRAAGTSVQKVASVRLGVATGQVPKVPMATTGSLPQVQPGNPSSLVVPEQRNWFKYFIFLVVVAFTAIAGFQTYQWWMSRPGDLLVSTKPQSVQVFVGGIWRGATRPGSEGRGTYSLQLPRGEIEVQLKAKGYKTVTESIVIQPGAAFKLAPDLAPDVPTEGQLDLVVFPAHATILHNDQPLKLEQGRGRLTLQEGRTAELRIRANNHQPQVLTVGPVDPGETIEQEIRLALTRWQAKITVKPGDARLEAKAGKRRETGTGELEVRGLHPAESLTVTVKAKGCRRATLKMSSEGQELVSKTVELRCRKSRRR